MDYFWWAVRIQGAPTLLVGPGASQDLVLNLMNHGSPIRITPDQSRIGVEVGTGNCALSNCSGWSLKVADAGNAWTVAERGATAKGVARTWATSAALTVTLRGISSSTLGRGQVSVSFEGMSRSNAVALIDVRGTVHTDIFVSNHKDTGPKEVTLQGNVTGLQSVRATGKVHAGKVVSDGFVDADGLLRAKRMWITSDRTSLDPTIPAAPALDGDIKDGDIKVSGKVSAASAKVDGQIEGGSATLTGGLTANSATLTEWFTAHNGTVTGGLSSRDLTVNGDLTAQSANFSGQVTARGATNVGNLTAGRTTLDSLLVTKGAIVGASESEDADRATVGLLRAPGMRSAESTPNRVAKAIAEAGSPASRLWPVLHINENGFLFRMCFKWRPGDQVDWACLVSHGNRDNNWSIRQPGRWPVGSTMFYFGGGWQEAYRTTRAILALQPGVVYWLYARVNPQESSLHAISENGDYLRAKGEGYASFQLGEQNLYVLRSDSGEAARAEYYESEYEEYPTDRVLCDRMEADAASLGGLGKEAAAKARKFILG